MAEETNQIEAYPWFLNKPMELKVNERSMTARISVQEWTDHWRPMLAYFHKLHQSKPERIIVAVGGPPGSGKSVLAEQFHWLGEKGFLPGCHVRSLPMDGFHYPNDYLRCHYRKMPDGLPVSLMEVKGAPETFDVDSLRSHLQQLKDHRDDIKWPGYSRIDHDPLPEHYHVGTGINVIFVEGNYLLLNRGPFADFDKLFDLRIYVDTPAAVIISTLIQRHTHGGKSLERAKEWVKRIDLPNARIAESTRANADLVIERNTNSELMALHWHNSDSQTQSQEQK